MHELYAGVIKAGFGVTEHERIAIKPDDAARGAELAENECTVTSGADGPIEHSQPRLELQPLQDLPRHNRDVNG